MPSSADGPTAPRLAVLDDVTWDGEPVPGERTHALLRSLADAGPRGLSETALVDEVWGDDVPANPTKALQVVVSRARSATSADAIERTARGYRLALAPADVDAWALRPEGLRLAAAGEYAAALPLLERARARRRGGRRAAALRRRRARRPGRAGALRDLPRGPRRPARRRPEPDAPGAARRAAGPRPPGPRGAALRGVPADRPRRATSPRSRRRSAPRGSPRSSAPGASARPGSRT